MQIAHSSPHLHSGRSIQARMLRVALATFPGLLALSICFGPGSLMNVLLAIPTAWACEAWALKLRGRPIQRTLSDGSATLCALLLALSLPPQCAVWLPPLLTAIAILLGKHAFGGLGYNLFNPAMLAYALALFVFPQEMTRWPEPFSTWDDYGALLLDKFWHTTPDAFSGATALEVLRHRDGLTMAERWAEHANLLQGFWSVRAWEWVNLGFLLGGLLLCIQRVIPWQMPVAMLLTLGFLAAVTQDGGSSHSFGGPVLHWFSGGIMLCAFFILTDPVTAPASLRARWIYAAGIGVLCFALRATGSYADGLAFAVLIMNAFVPMLDAWRWTWPRHADRS